MTISNVAPLTAVIHELNVIRRILINLQELNLDESVCKNIVRTCITNLEQKVLTQLNVAVTTSTEKDVIHVAQNFT